MVAPLVKVLLLRACTPTRIRKSEPFGGTFALGARYFFHGLRQFFATQRNAREGNVCVVARLSDTGFFILCVYTRVEN